MSTTVLAARRALMRDVRTLGEYHPITALAVGSVTVGSLANTEWPVEKFRHNILFRPEAASAADFVRYAGQLTVASGLIAHTGANYADTTITNEELEIWYDPDIRPDTDILYLMQDALDYVKAQVMIPLRHGPASADMQGSAVDSDWTESGASDTVDATASEVFKGAQSLTVTDSGSGNGYTQSALSPIGQGKGVSIFGIVKSDTGTSKLVALDGAGNEQASISTTQEDWMLLMKHVQFDAADEQIRLRLQEVAASDAGDWQMAWFVKEDDYIFRLTYLSERQRVEGIAVGKPQVSGPEADTYLAGSMDFTERLEEGVHYKCYRPRADANPAYIQMLPKGYKYMREPLFLVLSAPYSAPYGAAIAFSAETDETDCPLDDFLAQCKILLAERWPAKFADAGKRGESEKETLLAQEPPVLPATHNDWGGLFR